MSMNSIYLVPLQERWHCDSAAIRVRVRVRVRVRFRVRVKRFLYKTHGVVVQSKTTDHEAYKGVVSIRRLITKPIRV